MKHICLMSQNKRCIFVHMGHWDIFCTRICIFNDLQFFIIAAKTCKEPKQKTQRQGLICISFCIYGPMGHFFLHIHFLYYCNQNKRMLTVYVFYARLKIKILNIKYCLDLQCQFKLFCNRYRITHF